MMGKFGKEDKRREGYALVAELEAKWRPKVDTFARGDRIRFPDGSTAICLEGTQSGAENTENKDKAVVIPADLGDKVLLMEKEERLINRILDPVDVFPGWPRESVVVIAGACKNPRMVVGRIEDGRRVSVWQSRSRSLRTGAKIPCRLDLAHKGGDPMYLPV